MEILTSQLSCAVEALGRVGARPRDVAAIGITNQRETVIVWERATGKPIYPAIVWQDRRTAVKCGALEESGVGDDVSNRTGLVLDPYFSATKIGWILDNVPGARARAERGELAFGTVDSWLIWHLTSGQRHVTDVTNASRTLFYNIVKGEWDPELLRIFGIPKSLLPEVVWSSQRVGEVTTTLGLGGIAIAGIAGDQQAALFGQLCWSAGEAKNTYGTGCFLLQNIGTESTATARVCALEASADYHAGGQRAASPGVCARRQHLYRRRSGAVAARQSQVDWLFCRSGGTGGERARQRRRGALCRPLWAWARRIGTRMRVDLLIGLRRDTSPGHIARAALESIAFQVADVLEAVHSETGTPLGALRVDGGAAVNDLMMQFQADCAGRARGAASE